MQRRVSFRQYGSTFFQTTATIPADTLEVDDLVLVQAIIKTTSNTASGSFLTGTIKLAGTVISQNVQFYPLTNDMLLLRAEGVVTAAGASGTMKFTGTVLQSSPQLPTGQQAVTAVRRGGLNGFTNTAALSIDTTSTATLQVSAQWAVINDNSVCELRQLSYTVLAG